ncbi:MAG TPA: hypothetical protein PKD34_01990, partial [Candidatus Doudnabacteria bacterium]|nr:hypothetical protein [Candidatus Doudnabacteria bacterium]
MKKHISLTNILLGVLILSVVGAFLVWRQPSSTELAGDKGQFDTQSFTQFERGQIISVEEQRIDEALQTKTLYQRLSVKILTGSKTGEIFETDFNRLLDSKNANELKEGDKVVLGYLPPSQSEELLFGEVAEGEYVVVDRLRTSGLL